MTYAEQFALDEWLSDYPAFMTYDEIIQLMVGNTDEDEQWTHELISVWQTVEDCTLRQVADFIDGTRKHFENTIAHMKAEGAFA
jgi:hypothetical protein